MDTSFMEGWAPHDALDGRITLVRRPVPVPQTGQVCVSVEAAGLNRADLLQARGLYPAPAGASDLLGLEVCGTVVSTGPDSAAKALLGQRVCALLPGGGFAPYALAETALCLPCPPHLNAIEAAACPEALFTVFNMLFVMGGLAQGHALLFEGGRSGIGSFAIPVAKALGCKVHTTASTPEKAAYCTALGADRVLMRTASGTEPPEGPYQLAVVLGGGPQLPEYLKALDTDGRCVVLGTLSGAEATLSLPLLMRRRLRFTGATLRGRPLAELASLGLQVRQLLWPMVTSGRLKPPIQAVYKASEAPAALAAMKQGEKGGKIVLSYQ